MCCGVGETGHRGGTGYMSLLGPSAPKQAPSGVMGGVIYPSATPGTEPMPPFWGVFLLLVCLEPAASSAGGEGGVFALRLMAACCARKSASVVDTRDR